MSEEPKRKPEANLPADAIRPTKPKVFISYSWTSKERAIELADGLLGNGVDVVIDVYDLRGGMNKYAFMQRSVNDPSIEKVLLLCDKSYKEKADSFQGGVGDETMVISPEIYGKVEQEKFIPLVLERDEQGEPFLPAMVKPLIYFDLSDLTRAEEEFARLVRNLWGVPDRRKPALGPRPAWLEMPAANVSSINSQMHVLAAITRSNPNPDAVLRNAAHEITKSLNGLGSGSGTVDLVAAIQQTEAIRNCYVDLVEQAVLREGFSGEKIASMMETIYNGINQPDLRECYHFFFWDVFICTAALLIEYEKYADLRKILNRTYFLRNIIGTNNDPEPCSFSQFRQYHWALENVYRPKINPRLVSLSADMLVKREHGSIISKRNLVTADTTLAHLAMIYGQADSTWYPILAPYSHYAGCNLIWERLISKAFCEKLFPLFGVSTFQAFKQAVKEMSDAWVNAKGIHNSSASFGGIQPVLRQGAYEKMGSLP